MFCVCLVDLVEESKGSLCIRRDVSHLRRDEGDGLAWMVAVEDAVAEGVGGGAYGGLVKGVGVSLIY